MRSLTSVIVVFVVLVGVAPAPLVVARSEAQTPLPVTAAVRHDYYPIGERQCERTLKKAEAQQGSGQLLGFTIAIDTSKYPKEFRQAVAAGCQAAPG
jgi:hypothetical protein